MSEQDHQDVIDRLRALGRQPVPSSVADAHLAAISSVRGRVRFTRHAWRVAVVAAVVALATTGAAAVAFVGDPGEGAQKITTAGPGDPAGAARPNTGGPAGDDLCTGAPAFAGVIPESGQTRAGEAGEHSSIRQDCPAIDDTTDTTDALSAPGGAVVDPHPGDPCTGPPPFAGVIPESGQTRAGEAAVHSSVRQDCPATDDAAADDTTGTLSAPGGAVVDPHPGDPCTGPPPFAGVIPESGQTRADEAAVHSSVRQDCPATDDAAADDTSSGAAPNGGPPASTPGGPPAGTPAGPPEGVGGGPPASTPAGPPAGTPAGPPEGVGGGPPASTPAGPPEGVGGGPPASIPGGPPDGTGGNGASSGPPAGTPGGPGD